MVEAGREMCVGSWNGETNHSADLPLVLVCLFGLCLSLSLSSPFLTSLPDFGVCWGWIEDTREPPWEVCSSQNPWPQMR